MSNKTVYPYGTDGELPSSIGLVNDVVTGGADKALAAEQGVVLNSKITHLDEPVTETESADVYDYTETGWYIGGGNTWSNTSPFNSILIPIPRWASSVSVTVSPWGVLAFLKSDTKSVNGTPDFSDTYPERFYIEPGQGGTYTYTNPSDAQYLYVATHNAQDDIRSNYTISFVANYGGYIKTLPTIVDSLESTDSSASLSANQGNIIGKSVFGGEILVDLNELTVSNYSLSSTNTWLSKGLHIAVPVTPGEKYTIKTVYSQTTGAFYGFFTSSYSPPAATTDAVPLVSGTSRIWLNVNSSVNITIPNTAAYLCLCVRDGSLYTTDFELTKSVIDTSIDKVGTLVSNSTIGISEQIDLSEATKYTGYMAATAWNTSKGSYMVIPVSPGTVIKLRTFNSTSTGNFFAFLKTYTTPSSGSTIDYAYGCGRVWRNDSSGLGAVMVPYSAFYIVLETEDGSGDKSQWEIYNVNETALKTAIQNDCLKKENIINNIYEGGAENPLSAEQGKILGESLLDGGIPDGVEKHTYKGAPVVLGLNRHVGCKAVSQITSVSCQAGACYGNYLFLFQENNTQCWMYNLANSTLIQNIQIGESDRGFVSNCHCNSVVFGTEFYDSGDPFPLIYVSTGYSYGNYTGALVYRIIATTSDSVTTYSLSLVQTLKLPGSTWTEFLVGEDNDCYLCYTGQRKIYRMAMPLLSAGDMEFDLSNALETYQFTQQPSWYNGSRNQGRIYHNGKIYMVSGVPGSNETSLFIVLDLATRRREVQIDLIETLGLTSEPEACFFWRGHVCVAFRTNKYIYSLYFE